MPVYTDPKRYLGIRDGKIIEKLDNSNYREFTHLSAHLMNITFRQHDKGKVMQLHLIDEQDYFILGLFLNSFYAKSFLMLLPNIDPTHELTIVTSLKMDGDKKKGSLFVNQHGKPLKWYWTKDNLGDLPPMVKQNRQMHNGEWKEVWTDDDQQLYLEMYINQDVIPQLQKKPNPFPANVNYSGNTGNQIAGDYFGKEQRVGMVNSQSGAERSGAGSNTPAEITEPLDDLPF
jgi:hypothetical protein